MSFDGNGNWVADFSAVSDRDANIKILASRFDNIHQADLKASFEKCLTNDMQSKPLQAFNFNSFKGINLANPTNNTDAVNLQTLNSVADSKIGTKIPNSVGSGTNPVYTNASGVLTASSSTVGTVSTPVYMNSGTITACTNAMGTPNYSGMVSFSSGSTTTSNGWLKVKHHERTNCTVKAGSTTIYDHTWNGGDYGQQWQVSYMPIAKNTKVTFSATTNSTNPDYLVAYVSFVPCL